MPRSKHILSFLVMPTRNVHSSLKCLILSYFYNFLLYNPFISCMFFWYDKFSFISILPILGINLFLHHQSFGLLLWFFCSWLIVVWFPHAFYLMCLTFCWVSYKFNFFPFLGFTFLLVNYIEQACHILSCSIYFGFQFFISIFWRSVL